MKKRFLLLLTAAAVFFCAASPAAYALTPPLDIISDTYCVIDAASGQVLIEKGMSKRKAPASITKILTVALALERGADPNDRFVLDYKTCHSLEPGATHVALTEGEEIGLQDALMATMIMSANDAANAVAQYSAGSMDSFVPLMNQKVQELGLEGSHFANPNGLDQEGHYTTAYDMCLITRWALGVEGFTDYFSALSYTMSPTNKQPQSRPFNNRDYFIVPDSKYYYNGVVGAKLGYTYDARHTLAAAAKRGDMTLICVTMDSPSPYDKFKDAAKLLDYCFEHFGTLSLRAQNIQDFDVPILDGRGAQIGMVNVRAEEDIDLVTPKGASVDDLIFSFDVPDHYANGEEIAPVLTILDQEGNQLYQGPMAYSVVQAAASPHSLWKGQTFVYPIKETALAVLKWTGVVTGTLFVLLLVARFFIRRHYRRLQALRRRQRAEEQKRRLAALRRANQRAVNTPYDNVTYWPGVQPQGYQAPRRYPQSPPRSSARGGRR